MTMKQAPLSGSVRPTGDSIADEIGELTACIKRGDFFGAGRTYQNLEQRVLALSEFERAACLPVLEQIRIIARQAQGCSSSGYSVLRLGELSDAMRSAARDDARAEVLCTKCGGSYYEHDGEVIGQRIEWRCPDKGKVQS